MEEKITLRDEYIKLDQALKVALGIGGGQAKEMVQRGEVLVNGAVCLQRGKKLRDGDKAEAEGVIIRIQS
ncbi:MAG: RNA-binding S4 domain-containing protein [Ruminococcaceae bacterium]|nr:RNA-binding S4 domain-containing protein [Oscillospiraceae bacterium]